MYIAHIMENLNTSSFPKQFFGKVSISFIKMCVFLVELCSFYSKTSWSCWHSFLNHMDHFPWSFSNGAISISITLIQLNLHTNSSYFFYLNKGCWYVIILWWANDGCSNKITYQLKYWSASFFLSIWKSPLKWKDMYLFIYVHVYLWTHIFIYVHVYLWTHRTIFELQSAHHI